MMKTENEKSKIEKKGLLILSEDDDYAPQPFNHKLLWRLLRYLKPYQLHVVLMVSLSLIAVLTTLILPYLLKIAIDQHIILHTFKGFATIALLYAGVAIIQYFALLYQGIAMVKIGQQVIFDLRNELFEHVQYLSLSFFDRQKAGRIMLRITNDINSLEELLTSGVSIAFADSFTLVGLLITMFWVDWRLALVIFITLPVTIWVAVFLRNRMLEVSRLIRLKLSAVNANLNESLMGIRVTQAFNRENLNSKLFRAINEEHYQAAKKFVPINAFFWPWIGFLNTVGTASVLMAGGLLTIYGIVTLGTIAAFMNYINRFFQPIQNLSNLLNLVSTAMASCERIFELMELKPLVNDLPQPRKMGVITGEISFQGVFFEYQPNEPVLRDFNLTVKPGELIAIVGPTGAGKSTIINLLCRFYDPTAGTILVDGKNLKKISQIEYRKQIAVVLQDTFIFSGTIIENIRYGNPQATIHEVENVAQKVGIHNFILSQPLGYHTMVQERGSSLSVGQRQLIAFARALLRNPRILILDEATSNVDTQTEHQLQQALKQLLKGRTSLVIAHRLSTIRSADRILVIHDGRMIEMGCHEELLKQGGLYANLYECQDRVG